MALTDSIQPTILVVDDEKHTRDGLRRLLENDYDVYVSGDIAGAMSVLERERVSDLTDGVVADAELILGAAALENAGIVVDPVSRGLKRLPAKPLK